MRIFGSKTLENVLGKLGLKEGEAITHSLITKSLERAQQKVEANNYDIRKQILKFDDILNDQRKIIYQNRKEILTTKDQSKIVNEMIDDYIDELITICIPAKKYSHEWNSELLRSSLEDTFKINNGLFSYVFPVSSIIILSLEFAIAYIYWTNLSCVTCHSPTSCPMISLGLGIFWLNFSGFSK